MTKAKDIEAIWRECEEIAKTKPGGFLRKIVAGSPGKAGAIYAGIVVREEASLRCFMMAVSKKQFTAKFERLHSGLSLEILKPQDSGDKEFLALELRNIAFADLFAVLCEDLVHTIGEEQDEAQCHKLFIERIGKWEKMFADYKPNGLSPAECQGLFGELWFIKQLIRDGADPVQVLDGWSGIQGGAQDFRWGTIATEVKTSKGNAESIRIYSLGQLDIVSLDKLFLFHLVVNEGKYNGLTLPQMVIELTSLIASYGPIANSLFVEKLAQCGYFVSQEELYIDVAYEFRAQNLYVVSENFPRLTSSTVPEGIETAEYKIRLESIAKFEVSFADFFHLFNAEQ